MRKATDLSPFFLERMKMENNIEEKKEEVPLCFKLSLYSKTVRLLKSSLGPSGHEAEPSW